MSEQEVLQETIQEILNGKLSKFEGLVTKYQTLVFRTAMGFVHNKEDAEDLTQDVFNSAFKSLANFQGNFAFSTWLYRITVNTCINHLKRNKQRAFLQQAGEFVLQLFNTASGDNNPHQQLEESEQHASIRMAIDSLSEKQQTAFVLSKYDDLPQKEIAAIMQCSEGSVEQHLQRAKTNLKKKLAHLVGK
jgi:RNA polymerase sigma-70 factor, ECF subfamily